MNVRNFRVGVKTAMGLAQRPSEKIPVDVLLKTADVLLKTADVLLKTADVLLKTADLHFGVPGAEGSSRRLVYQDSAAFGTAGNCDKVLQECCRTFRSL